MKHLRIIGALSLTLAMLAGAPINAAQPNNANVMILGVAHLVAHRDVHNSAFTDSPLSPTRQAQIADIVRRLACFHPTKVLVEAEMDDPTTTKQYQQYLAKHFVLPANEIYQFGFKLAAAAGDAAIYPIDTFGPQSVDENSPSGKRIDAYLEANLPHVDDKPFNAYVAHDDMLEQHGTYLDVLRYLNTDAAIRANASSYSIVDGMGRSADNAGTVYVAGWYTRNTYIFSNILSVIRPGDRVVVIMGQGHEYLLREFTRLNPNLTYVDPLAYLGTSR